MSTPALRIVDTNLVRRTFQLRRDQAAAIQALGGQTGDSWSAIVRRLIDLGLAEDARIAKLARRKAR